MGERCRHRICAVNFKGAVAEVLEPKVVDSEEGDWINMMVRVNFKMAMSDLGAIGSTILGEINHSKEAGITLSRELGTTTAKGFGLRINKLLEIVLGLGSVSPRGRFNGRKVVQVLQQV